jgi:spore germination cell wall hydrolase CwlJ-like protein
MLDGRYAKVAHTPDQVAARSAALLAAAQAWPAAWARARRIAGEVLAGTYHGAAYDRLGDAAVLYLNPAISRAAWAMPDKRVCVIGRHDFFRA